jgi:hypothetical protein
MTSPQEGMGTFPGCTVAHTSEVINSCSGAPPAAASGGAAGKLASGAQSTAAGSTAVQAGANTVASAPNIMTAVNVATKPAAAFEPTLGAKPDSTSTGAAGHSASGSSTFGITAAGGPAPEQSEPQSGGGGCNVAAVGGTRVHGLIWLAAFALSTFAIPRIRARDKKDKRRQSRSLWQL